MATYSTLLKLPRDFIKYGAPTPSTQEIDAVYKDYVANRLAHRYGFGCAADSAHLFEDAICTKAGLNETWLEDLDRRAPGLFQVARQIVA